jgi:hypothetical protein
MGMGAVYWRTSKRQQREVRIAIRHGDFIALRTIGSAKID